MQIAVIRDHRSDARALLEGLSRIPFPSDKELVTPCSIQIKLKRTPGDPSWRGVIKQKNPKYMKEIVIGKYTDPDKLGIMITELINSSVFGEDTIIVELSSPNAPNFDILYLSDSSLQHLGTGEEKYNHTDTQNRFIGRFLIQTHTIILVAIPVTQDMSTAGVLLQIAKKYDPKGSRTIGVISKPDHLQASSATCVLEGLGLSRNPLRVGYVIISNRRADSQLVSRACEQSLHDHENYFFAHHQRQHFIANRNEFNLNALYFHLYHVLANKLIDELISSWYLLGFGDDGLQFEGREDDLLVLLVTCKQEGNKRYHDMLVEKTDVVISSHKRRRYLV